jgi:hypothetical protein
MEVFILFKYVLGSIWICAESLLKGGKWREWNEGKEKSEIRVLQYRSVTLYISANIICTKFHYFRHSVPFLWFIVMICIADMHVKLFVNKVFAFMAKNKGNVRWMI